MLKGTLQVLKDLSIPEWIVLIAVLCLIGWLTSRFDNPIQPIPRFRRLVLFGLIVINGFVISQMSQGVLTKVDEVENGIIDFEMAKTEDRAKSILSAWNKDGNRVEFPEDSGKLVLISDVARRDIVIDFGFILSYVALLGYICFWMAGNQTIPFFSRAGTMLGWGVVIAGILDMVENTAMLIMLKNGATRILATISFWSALPKFAITLGFVVVYIFVALVALDFQTGTSTN